MGFPSPAADFEEGRISLDNRLITKPAATYFMRASETCYREGIISGALLVIDSSLTPCDGSLLICSVDGELRIKRYRRHPVPHLVNVHNGQREKLPDSEGYGVESPVFGVITYIINDARSGEFDDCPVM
ncbi:LexA family transcriptional regulator [Yokenella regensburgei]|uniref:HumD family translesion DNA polymerase n=1 Tax=Yokenella regensburgei TaxID=158877 RepID=UPI003F1468D8